MALKATLEELGMSIAPDNSNNRRRSKVQNRAIPRHNKTEGQAPANKGKTMNQNAQNVQNAQHVTGSEMADKARQMLVEQIGKEASASFENAVKQTAKDAGATIVEELKQVIVEANGDAELMNQLKEHTQQLAMGLAEAGQANAKTILEEVEALHSVLKLRVDKEGRLSSQVIDELLKAGTVRLTSLEANAQTLLYMLEERETRDQKRARLTRKVLFWTAVAAAVGLVGFGVVLLVRYMLSSPKLVAQVPPGTGTLDATMASPVGNSLPTL